MSDAVNEFIVSLVEKITDLKREVHYSELQIIQDKIKISELEKSLAKVEHLLND